MREAAVLLAAADLAVEPGLVSAAARCGIVIRRRCLDAADLLAAASLDEAAPVLLSPGLPRLSAEVVCRLAGREIIGLATTSGDLARLRELGVATVVDADGPADAVMGRLAELGVGRSSGVWVLPEAPRETGRLVAVWGPPGAPGRSEVALGLAEAAAGLGGETLLVDADTHGPALAQRLGVVDEASGLLIACRQADHGRLAPTTLLAAARSLAPRLSLLTGLPSASRWRDVRPSSIEELWSVARRTFATTVADIASCLEEESAAASGSAALGARRNAVARSLVREADALVVVVRPDALGLVRAAQALPEVLALCPQAHVVLAVNGVTRGRRSEAAKAAAGIEQLISPAVLEPARTVLLPWDRRLARAVARGSLLAESGRMPLGRALRAVVQEWPAAGRSGQGEGSTTTMVPILANS